MRFKINIDIFIIRRSFCKSFDQQQIYKSTQPQVLPAPKQFGAVCQKRARATSSFQDVAASPAVPFKMDLTLFNMITQNLLKLREPETHTSQLSCTQKLCCRNYSLSSEQLQEFYALKTRANVLFEPPNERWDLVKALYKEYFDKECPEGITTKDWLKLGFQGDRPERDLRGGGVLSLELVLDFVKRQKPTVKSMSEESNDFFFAVSSINISFFMKKFFHLSDLIKAQLDRHQYCNRRSLKNFCRLLMSNRKAYEDMHRIFLLYFYHRIWMGLKREGKNITLLNFNEAFDKLKESITEIFNERDYEAWVVFESTFRSQY